MSPALPLPPPPVVLVVLLLLAAAHGQVVYGTAPARVGDGGLTPNEFGYENIAMWYDLTKINPTAREGQASVAYSYSLPVANVTANLTAGEETRLKISLAATPKDSWTRVVTSSVLEVDVANVTCLTLLDVNATRTPWAEVQGKLLELLPAYTSVYNSTPAELALATTSAQICLNFDQNRVDALGLPGLRWGEADTSDGEGMQSEQYILNNTASVNRYFLDNLLMFETGARAGLELVVYPVTRGNESCANVSATNTPLLWTQDFGADTVNVSRTYTVYSTFTVPDVPFFMCFRRMLYDHSHTLGPYSGYAWLPVIIDNTRHFVPKPFDVYYEPPEYGVSEGQHFAFKIFNHERRRDDAMRLTLPVDASDASAYHAGDMVKLVPAGWACTYEASDPNALNETHDYYGSAIVNSDGSWQSAAIDLQGLAEGSLPGGFGLFGSERVNPVAGDAATNLAAASVNGTDGPVESIVVYAVATAAVSFDVCFSMAAERAVWSAAAFNRPMWRKLRACSTLGTQNETLVTATTPALCHPTKASWHGTHSAVAESAGINYTLVSEFNPGRPTLAGAAEKWRWSIMDRTPETFGWLRIAADAAVGGEGLHPAQATSHDAGGMRQYYTTVGGDQVRLVRSDAFMAAGDITALNTFMTARRNVSEFYLAADAYDDVGGAFEKASKWLTTATVMDAAKPTSAGASLVGTAPDAAKAGAWHRADDAYAEFGSGSPTASFHLSRDPQGYTHWFSGTAAAGATASGHTAVGADLAVAITLDKTADTIAFAITANLSGTATGTGRWVAARFGGSGNGTYTIVVHADGMVTDSHMGDAVALNGTAATILRDTVGGLATVHVVKNLTAVAAVAAALPSASFATAGTLAVTLGRGGGDGAAFPGFDGVAASDTVRTGALGYASADAAAATAAYAAVRVPAAGGTWRVCYRPAGRNGWRVLPQLAASAAIGDWQPPARTYTADLVPVDERAATGTDVMFYWSADHLTGGTETQLTVRTRVGEAVLSTQPNTFGVVKPVSAAAGYALRVVPAHAGCEGLQAAGLLAPAYSESRDAGLTGCTLVDLHDPAKDCSGPANDAVTAATEVQFYSKILASDDFYRVCIRYGGRNWQTVHARAENVDAGGALVNTTTVDARVAGSPYPGTAGLMIPDADTRVTLRHSDTFMAGRDVLMIVEDASGALRARGDGSGDWMRLVASGSDCVASLPADRGTASFAAPLSAHSRALSAVHLQLWCPDANMGAACRADPVVQALYCAGDADCATPEAAFATHMATMLQPAPWNRVAPRSGVPHDAVQHVAGVFNISAASASVGGSHQLCYKKHGENWVRLELLGAEGAGTLSPAEAFTVAGAGPRRGAPTAETGSTPAGVMVGGEVSRVDITAPVGADPTQLAGLTAKLVPQVAPPGTTIPEEVAAFYGFQTAAKPLRGASAALASPRSMQLTVDIDGGDAVITIQTEATTSWVGVGFGASRMKDTYVIVAYPTGAVEERQMGDHLAGTVLTASITVDSDVTLQGWRRLVLRRPRVGASAAHYTFPDAAGDVPYITAVGDDGILSYHGANRVAQAVAMAHPIAALQSSTTFGFKGTSVTVAIDEGLGRATITLTGDASAWYAVAFGATRMENAYAVMVTPPPEGTTISGVQERQLGDHNSGTLLEPMVRMVAHAAANGNTTVTLERSLVGATNAHYSFSVEARISYLIAVGEGPELVYHGAMNRVAGTAQPVPPKPSVETRLNTRCGLPAGGTTGTPFGAVSSHVEVHADNRTATLTLIAPDVAGDYEVCVQPAAGAGWAPAGTAVVVDSEVRWSMPPPAQPVNQGAQHVDLKRCRETSSFLGCSTDGSSEFLDLRPGGDAVKVVPVFQTNAATLPAPAAITACHAGDDANVSAWYGGGAHVGLEVDPTAQLGDLGEGDALSKVGHTLVTLPTAPNDASTWYKLCVRTKVRGEARWVEARSELAQALRTAPAGVDRFALSGGVLAAAAAAETDAVVLAGSTLLTEVALEQSTAPGADLSGLGALPFKLVRQRTYTGAAWQLLPGDACGSGVAAVTGAAEARGDGSLVAKFVVPNLGTADVALQEYLVCVQHPAAGGVWTQVVAGTTARGRALTALPLQVSYNLEGDGAAITFYDESQTPRWCNATDACGEFFAVVPAATPLCPAPGDAAYRPLTQTSPISASGVPALPPSADGRYFVCLYRNATLASTAGLFADVPYRVWNGGADATGGGSAYYIVPSAAVEGLQVEAVGRTWDAATEILVCGTPCVVPSAAQTHASGLETRSVVLENHVLDVRLSLVSGRQLAGVVHVEFCEGGADAECKLSTRNPLRAPFALEVDRGLCAADESDSWGWAANGLSQPLADGAAVFTVRLLSLCPTNALLLGCGFRFSAVLDNGATYDSRPVWVNNIGTAPTEAIVAATVVTVSQNGAYECVASRPCDAFAFTAAAAGQRVGAPRGAWGMKIEFVADEVLGVPSTLGAAWTGSDIELLYTPALYAGVASSVVRVTLTYTGGAADVTLQWTVTVVRAPVVRVDIIGVHPTWMDVEGDAVIAPQPTWEGDLTHAMNGTTAHSETWARRGAHITALYPYELELRAYDAFGLLPPAGIGHLRFNWTLTTADGEPISTEENGLFAPAVRPEEVEYTVPHHLVPLDTLSVKAAYDVKHYGAGVGAIPFRMGSPRGCTRFAANNTGLYEGGGRTGGCRIALTLVSESGAAVVPGVVAEVVTSVRGLADMLRVEVLTENRLVEVGRGVTDGAADLDLQTELRVPASPGLSVWITAASVYGAYVDEFIYTPVRALFAPSSGFPQRQGSVGPQGLTLVQDTYDWAFHEGRGWGIMATLHIRDAVIDCSFRFETAGAGGGVAYTHDDYGKIATAGGHIKGVQFYDPTVRFVPVVDVIGATWFTVALVAVDAAGEATNFTTNATAVLDLSEYLRNATGHATAAFLRVLGENSTSAGVPTKEVRTVRFVDGRAELGEFQARGAVADATYMFTCTVQQDASYVDKGLATEWPSAVDVSFSLANVATLPPHLVLTSVEGPAELLATTNVTAAAGGALPANATSEMEYVVHYDSDAAAPLHLSFQVQYDAYTPFEGLRGGVNLSVLVDTFLLGPQDGINAAVGAGHGTAFVASADATVAAGYGMGGLRLGVNYVPGAARYDASLVMFQEEVGVCKDCRIEVCSVLIDSIFGSLLSEDLRVPCVRIRLYATAATGRGAATRGLALAGIKTFTDAGIEFPSTFATPLIPCNTSVALSVVPWLRVGNDTSIDYLASVRYSVYQQGQNLQVVHEPRVAVDAAATQGTLALLQSSFVEDVAQVDGTVACAAARFVVGVEAPDGVVTHEALLTDPYAWAYPSLAADRLAVMDAALRDQSCAAAPSRFASLNAAHDGYQVFKADPGLGLEYASPTAGPSVGVPFLMSAAVVTAAGAPIATYPTTRVALSRAGVQACGDGGTLTTLMISRDANVTGDMTHVTAFAPVGAGDVFTTSQGVANFWLNFSRPCQQCTLRMQLCYSNDPAEGCLTPAADTAAVLPLVGRREVITKPFSVVAARPTNIVITHQAIPMQTVGAAAAAASKEMLYVGDAVRLKVLAARVLGGWVFGAEGTVRVAVEVRRADAGGGVEFVGAAQRYAYGGFIGRGAGGAAGATAPCGAPDADGVRGEPAARWGMTVDIAAGLASAASDVAFHFTRPCEGCEVWVRGAVLTGAFADLPAFPLRRAAYASPPYDANTPPVAVGDILKFSVRTCGMRWSLAPPTPRAVYAKRPFTLALLETDAAGFPVYDEGAHKDWARELATSNGSHISLALEAGGGGNGDGGFLLHWDPAVEGFETFLGAAEFATGVLLPTLEYSHACYECTLGLLRGVRMRMRVASEFARFVLVPEVIDTAAVGRARVYREGATHTVGVQMYAADRSGDKATTFGGPSELRHRRMYQPVTQLREVYLELLRDADVQVVGTIANSNTTRAPTTGTMTARGGSATLARSMYYVRDGVLTNPQLMNETLLLSLSGRPLGTPEFQVVLNRTAPARNTTHTDANGNILTFPVGSFSPAPISIAVEPTSLVVTRPAFAAGTMQAVQHEWYDIEVKAVGLSQNQTYFTTLGDGDVWIEACEAYFGVDGIGKVKKVAMQNGTAVLPIRFFSGTGECRMTVRHGTYFAGHLDVHVTEPGAAYYLWNSSATVHVERGVRAGYMEGRVLAGVGAAHIDVAVTDAALRQNAYYRYRKLADARLVFNPPGCFVPAGDGAPAVTSGTAAFAGNFSAAVMAGASACEVVNITSATVGVAMYAKLRIKVASAARVAVIPFTTALGQRDFSGDGVGFGKAARGASFGYHTGAGMPAVAVNRETTLTLGVFSADGTLATADHSSVVRITSSPLAANRAAAFRIDTTRPVVGGLATFTFIPPNTTSYVRNVSATATELVHNPLVLSAELTNDVTLPPLALSCAPPQPLYVTLVATRVRISLRWNRPAPGAREDPSAWVFVADGDYYIAAAKQAFDMKFEAVDTAGNTATADEHAGADAVVTVSRVEVPCRKAHALTLDGSCVEFAGRTWNATGSPRAMACMQTATMPHTDACQSAHWERGGAAILPTELAMARGVATLPDVSVQHPLSWDTLRVLASGLGLQSLSFRFQAPKQLTIEGAATCGLEGNVSTCDFPESLFAKGPHTGAITLAMLNGTTAEELGFDMNLPRHLVSGGADNVDHSFTFVVVLADADNLPVHSNLSVITLYAHCASEPDKNDRLLGQWDADAEAVDYSSFVDDGVVMKITRPLSAGRAVFEGLAFAEYCVDAVFVAECSMPAHLDPSGTCNGRQLTTTQLDVMRPLSVSPTPVPARPNDYAVVALTTGYTMATLDDFEQYNSIEEVEELLAEALQTREVCRTIDTGEVSFIKRETCDPRAAMCECRTLEVARDGAPIMRDDVRIQWVCLVTQRDATFMRLDELKTQYARCRQRSAIVDPLSVLEPELRGAAELEGEQYHVAIEVEVRVGEAGNVTDAARVANAAAMAFGDRGTEMYQSLQLYLTATWAVDVTQVVYIPRPVTPAPPNVTLSTPAAPPSPVDDGDAPGDDATPDFNGTVPLPLAAAATVPRLLWSSLLSLAVALLLL